MMALPFVVDPDAPTLSRWLDHFDHAVEVMGIEHVGLGADFVDQVTPIKHGLGLDEVRQSEMTQVAKSRFALDGFRDGELPIVGHGAPRTSLRRPAARGDHEQQLAQDPPSSAPGVTSPRSARVSSVADGRNRPGVRIHTRAQVLPGVLGRSAAGASRSSGSGLSPTSTAPSAAQSRSKIAGRRTVQRAP